MSMNAPTLPPKRRPSDAIGKRITDFEDLRQVFSRWEGRFEQLSTGAFRATIRTVRGQSGHAFAIQANQALLVRGSEGSQVRTLTAVLPENTGTLFQGRSVDPGCVVVRDGEVASDLCTAKADCSLSVGLSESRLREAARHLHRTELHPVGWTVSKPSPRVFARFQRAVSRWIAAAGPELTQMIGPYDQHYLEQACVEAAVDVCLAEGTDRIELSAGARSQLVRRAEQWMRERLHASIDAVAVCAALDVSGRTLRLAFRERFGLGPMAYLQTLRLNAARTDLKTATDEISVRDVARRLGFQHLGKFAGYYRRQFGELPSATLRHRRPTSLAVQRG